VAGVGRAGAPAGTEQLQPLLSSPASPWQHSQASWHCYAFSAGPLSLSASTTVLWCWCLLSVVPVQGPQPHPVAYTEGFDFGKSK
jgi:hypothetical protein